MQWIRQQPSLRDLCIVTLSGSDEPRDMKAAYELGAGGYLVKPLKIQQLIDACGTIEDRWLRVNNPCCAQQPGDSAIRD
jgi:CheY-like chemotaxis protein